MQRATPSRRKFARGTSVSVVLAALCLAGLSAPRAAKQPESVSTALPLFTDVTEQAGLARKITCGDEVTEYLIDVNGQGACLFDYDNDGFQDIYLVNGSSRKAEASGQLPHDYLFRNTRDGAFRDVTREAGLGASGWHSGCAVGDYDNDGDLDLYVTNFGPNKLYRNNGDGTLVDVTEVSGVAGPQWELPKWSMGAAFGDFDNDGHLDLYVTNFVNFDLRAAPLPQNESTPCKLKGVPIVCAPDFFAAQQDLLYRNNGDGTFTDVSRKAGIFRPDPERGFAVVFSDFDNDGDADLYVANDSGPNHFYVNNGDATFTDASWISGTAVDLNGESQGSMGLTAGDYNNDGLFDIFVTNFVEQSNTLYDNEGGNLFIDRSSSLGLSAVGFEYSGWGTKFFDFDNDGWLDLFIVNGHTDERLEKQNPSDTYAQPNYLLRNMSGTRFIDVSDATGIRRLAKAVGRGTAFGDYDNDGDVDILVINKNDFPRLLRNDGRNANRWLVIRAEGVKSNRSGIGARVTVFAGGVRRVFEVRNSDSYLSSNDLRLHIGMGQLEGADWIEIRWPSGHLDRHTNVTANQFYLAREGAALKSGQR